ncbi:MAG TPA: LemA family protein [Egibacteraceae bacterium]|nr:LemA family protein [Egibacteraceae bacterium]
MGLWIALGVVVLVLLWAAGAYNRLVGLRNKVREAWSGIDVQLTRRADLIPNLVETVRGYRIHEREVLENVTQARAGLMGASGPRQAAQAENMLEQALGRLFAVAEDYPDLKANENFLALQSELSELEEEIAFSRRFYNALVQELNTAIQRVPTVIVARAFGFSEAEFFQAEDAARAVPGVDFS